METLAQLAPLIILIPSVGAFTNFFFGTRIGETASAIIGSVASGLSFIIAVLLLSYLTNNNYNPAVINPPFLDSWIRMDSIGLDIPWQLRVDTLSVAMMLFVTFVGTLIHIYAAGYMHGDPRFSRFFAYLNMFLAFMLTLITANNFLMMFVGWEGVGLCSYLLIGFWWDKPHGEGWKNGNAARKAFIVNRIGDFGVLMAIFLIFWAFGTLDFFKPGELANPEVGAHHGEEHADEEHATDDDHATDEEHSEEGDHEEEADDGHEGTNLESAVVMVVYQEDDHGEDDAAEHAEEDDHAAADDHGEEGDHGEEHHGIDAVPDATTSFLTEGVEPEQLGVFGQVELLFDEQEATGETIEFEIGPFTMDLETLVVLITMFMLLGATGKSAQIPLFVWLPDAMAGPTPVSALIHAATMVTSGVYMMVRSNSLFYHADLTSFVVTIVGATTALVAGFIAVGQFDIKRVLAYSTVSQLGFMVAAVGIGAYPAAMFHMITHAFFKALLFLGSGSVIHGMEHGHHHIHEHGHHDDHGDHHDDHFDPQDMRTMGGLRRKMPITYYTYLFGTLALAGIWPFAGFWSKDEILADSWLVGFEDGELKGYIALGLLIIAAGFTAFYMWRQIEMVFHGNARHEAAEHAHESPWQMTLPLVILAFFSLFIGFINIPSALSSIFVFGLNGSIGLHSLGDFLEHSIVHFHLPDFQPHIALSALALGLGAIFTARSIYGDNKSINAQGKDPLEASPSTAAPFSLANARLYWDEIYFRLIENPYNRLAAFFADVLDWNFWHDYFHEGVIFRGYNALSKLLSRPFDLGVIDGAVNGIGRLVQFFSGNLRQIQTGYVRTYAVALFFGVVLVIVIMLLPLIEIG